MPKDNTYVVLQSFMINELNLKGTELITYAIIYGFNQDCNTKYEGSLSYLAEWNNCDKRTIQNALKSLVDKGLLIKEEIMNNNVKFIKYSTTQKIKEAKKEEKNKSLEKIYKIF